MKTRTLKLMSLALGVVFLSSCSELLYTSVDVLRPARVAFAPEVKHLLIVNNTVTQPADYGHKTDLLNAKTKNVTIFTDSLSIFTTSVLGEDIESKGFFNSVQTLPNSINKGKNFAAVTPLDSNEVKKLCAKYHADVLISLDRLKVNDDLSEYFSRETNLFLGVLEARYESLWSVYYSANPVPVQFQYKDTIAWESETYNKRFAIANLPIRTDALVDGALNVGKRTVDRFVPYWEKEDRYFYNSRNKDIKRGIDSVYVKNWKAAIEIWKTGLQKSRNRQVKAEAANNIAVAYEILGDIDNAIEYASQSMTSCRKAFIADKKKVLWICDYIVKLKKRKVEIIKLKQQLGE